MDTTKKTVLLRQRLNKSIDDDLADRTTAHKADIARLRVGAARLKTLSAPPAPQPLVLLAHGDSWFDYPLSGNDLSLTGPTDIIAHLKGMGSINPRILNLSHYGDATTDEMSLPKQQRMIKALSDPDNWLDSGKPDAILFSGGGNNIAGDQFCIFLDYAVPGGTGIDEQRFQGVLDEIKACYHDLFAFRDRYAPGVRIIGHCYDFPWPNGVHPLCAGPWLKPSLDYCGWTDVQKGALIVKEALTRFKGTLDALSSEPKNLFFVVQTQNVLTKADWANELHPYPHGFQKLADTFVKLLRGQFSSRI